MPNPSRFPATYASLAAGIVLTFLAIVVYHDSFAGPFIWDDVPAIVGNPNVRLLKTDPWRAMQAPWEAPLSGRPVVALTFAINYAIGGMNVWGYHAVNLLIHIATSVLLFGVARRTLLRMDAYENRPSVAFGIALAIAAVWVVHPINSEGVLYLLQRTEQLASMFILLSVYCAIRGLDSESPNRRAWRVAAVAACLLGMGSKEIACATPLIILLWDWKFGSGGFGRGIGRNRAFYAALASTWVVQGLLVHFFPRDAAAGTALGISPWTNLLTQAGVILRYLRLCVWPHPLALAYDWPWVRTVGESLPATAIVAAILIVTFWSLKKRQAAGWLGAMFFIILAPTSSVIPLVTEVASERRMYLASAAVIALMIGSAASVIDRFAKSGTTSERWGRANAGVAMGILILVVASLAWTCQARVANYRDEITLWSDNLAKFPNSTVANNNLGRALIIAGRIDEAEPYVRRLLELEPSSATGHLNLGIIYAARNQPDDAQSELDEAVARAPNEAIVHFQRGLLFARVGKTEKAMLAYQRAVDLDPDSVMARENLGALLVSLGYFDEAIANLNAALSMNPNSVVALNHLAIAQRGRGDLKGARESLKRLLQIDPLNAPAYNTLGAVQANEGDLAGARASFQRAIELRPDFAEAKANIEKLGR